MQEFDRLVAIMARLRGPGGCPWDAQQTHQSLRQYMLEEVYEVLEAVDEGDLERLGGELGDLLLQIVFHAQIANDEGRFDIADVCRKISDKLEYRHPHVFADTQVRDADEVLVNWEQLKNREAEHRQRQSALDGVPRGLPALQQALELQKKAAKVGFDWPEVTGPLEKVGEEAGELLAASEQADVEAEFGDLLFALVNCARFMQVDPEAALREANTRFSRRFRHVESAAEAGDKPLAAMTLAEMDVLWEQAKAEEGQR
jgi:tetrapyrrole methylase family protein/MazG family protein